MEKIKQCRKCELYKNQNPLLDEEKKEVGSMFLGVSAVKIKEKMIKKPLGKDTRSGKVIYEIEELAQINIYKSNIVKCLPLDKNNKVRNPSKLEMKCCYENFTNEIKIKKISKVVLLGKDVSSFILDKKIEFPKLKEGFNYECFEKDGIKYLAVHHPSYMLRKRKDMQDRYKEIIADFIK